MICPGRVSGRVNSKSLQPSQARKVAPIPRKVIVTRRAETRLAGLREPQASRAPVPPEGRDAPKVARPVQHGSSNVGRAVGADLTEMRL